MLWRVEAAGLQACETLACGPHIVQAVFQRSCYVQAPSGDLVCLGAKDIGRGPINAWVLTWRAPELGQPLHIALEVKAPWPGHRERLRWSQANAAALRRAAPPLVPPDGLGQLLLAPAQRHSSPLLKRALPAVAALSQWLSGETDVIDADHLIGLGPGLTPSGDDYLGGVLIGLHCVGQTEKAQALWAWLAPRLASSTNLISAAHLKVAATGEGHELLHQCMLAISQGHALTAALANLRAMGHSSGWDALAGVMAAVLPQPKGQGIPVS